MAELGPEFLVDSSGARPVLRVVGVESYSAVYGESLTVQNGVSTLAKPLVPGTLRVWLNGVRLSEPGDYSVAGQTITFLPHYHASLAEPATVLKADYHTSSPQSTRRRHRWGSWRWFRWLILVGAVMAS